MKIRAFIRVALLVGAVGFLGSCIFIPPRHENAGGGGRGHERHDNGRRDGGRRHRRALESQPIHIQSFTLTVPDTDGAAR
jgi:hypothetical protein